VQPISRRELTRRYWKGKEKDMDQTDNGARIISDYIQKNAHLYPDHTAFVYQQQRISYREFADQVDRLARYLIKLGVQRHDRIACLLETQPEYFCLCMAASRVGAVLVGMGIKLMPPELEYIINNSESTYVFVSGNQEVYLQRIQQIAAQCPTIKKIFVLGKKNEAGYSDISWFEDIFQEDNNYLEQELKRRELQVNTDDGVMMVYTSGTTGKPKGVLLTHRNIMDSAKMEASYFRTTWEDVWFDSMPVNHVGGAIVQGITPLLTGATVVLLPTFSPGKTLELIQSEKVTVMGGVPTMYSMIFNHPDYNSYDKSSLRIVHFGGSMPTRHIIEKVMATMTNNVFNCLGMTEVAGIVSYTPTGLSAEHLSKSVGRVMPGIEWKLVDQDRNPVARGQVGELALRGSTVIKEYYRHPQANDESFDEEGWFYGGDLFYENADGLLIFMGRKKEMFITGGENVYIAEVEEVICSHEKVQTVALVPVPDAIYGEIGYAFVVPRKGCEVDEAELKAFVKSRIASFKVPRRFIIRNQLPLNPVGKVDKKALIDEIVKNLQNNNSMIS